ncbi:MAG: 1-acyl-sn-glycerol-3-phosphate acyltransferase [Bermanella sp.]|jgi:1-acyl-sn-glycerol-3-phosphate acyltransferase
MLTILTAPLRALVGFITLVSMIISAIALYLIVNNDKKRKQLIEICQRRLCAILLRCFNVEIRYIGKVNMDAKMIVANHISWLDALLFMPAPKLRFIAKSQVKNWPIIGLLAQLLGTVFIRRENKFQVYRSLPNAQRHIREGDNLVIFPEGTTTVGLDVLPFRPMIFEVAKREACMVQPVAIRYWNHKQIISQTTPFIDDDGILMSILKLLVERKTYAYVHFLPALDGAHLDRKQMAQQSQVMIHQALQQPFSAHEAMKNNQSAPSVHAQS